MHGAYIQVLRWLRRAVAGMYSCFSYAASLQQEQTNISVPGEAREIRREIHTGYLQATTAVPGTCITDTSTTGATRTGCFLFHLMEDTRQ